MVEIKVTLIGDGISDKEEKVLIKLITEREKYRKEKNWKKADEIRSKINNLGFIIPYNLVEISTPIL